MTNAFHIFIIAVKHDICIVLVSTWSWTNPHFSAFNKSYRIVKAQWYSLRAKFFWISNSWLDTWMDFALNSISAVLSGIMTSIPSIVMTLSPSFGLPPLGLVGLISGSGSPKTKTPPSLISRCPTVTSLVNRIFLFSITTVTFCPSS